MLVAFLFGGVFGAFLLALLIGGMVGMARNAPPRRRKPAKAAHAAPPQAQPQAI
ncbi:hypothetical protein [Acidocella sp. KAb 2-4]|uniref:hypothetical protein n=1 Tax=Acidocella sp. KAb 2-4 TaxID=2885158 RepID=UPI001D08C0B8|nr:hypothetical protein [Acidocella sp. KAb 2-4]MCB5943912.1 hypothetical protein [Acidocella sp. KAb 2-4]